MITPLVLPYPPSLNRLWRAKKNVLYRSERYLNWLDDAKRAMKRQPVQHYTGKVDVWIMAKRPDRRARDIDNLSKPILDLLENQNVIVNDHFVETLVLWWTYREDAWGVSVWIEDNTYEWPFAEMLHRYQQAAKS